MHEANPGASLVTFEGMPFPTGGRPSGRAAGRAGDVWSVGHVMCDRVGVALESLGQQDQSINRDDCHLPLPEQAAGTDGQESDPQIEQLDLSEKTPGGLWEATRSLKKRLEVVEARPWFNPQTIKDLISNIQAGLEAQCAALYREQSQTLTKQMADLLAEVQTLQWKALADGDSTRRLEDSGASAGSEQTHLEGDATQRSECSKASTRGEQTHFKGDATQRSEFSKASTRLEQDTYRDPPSVSPERSVPEETAGSQKDSGRSCHVEAPGASLSGSIQSNGDTATPGSKAIPLADIIHGPGRLCAWTALDTKDLAFRRLDERVAALEARVNILVSAPTTCRGQDETRQSFMATAATSWKEESPRIDNKGLDFALLGLPSTLEFHSAGVAAEVSVSRVSATPVLGHRCPPSPPSRHSLRLVHSASAGALRQPLGAPPPRTDPEPRAGLPRRPAAPPVVQHWPNCPSPAPAMVMRGRVVAPPSNVGATQELRGRCPAASTSPTPPAGSLASSLPPGAGRSVSPIWHDFAASSGGHRPGPVPHGAVHSGPCASLPQTKVLPSSPPAFTRRQSSSPSPHSLASRLLCRPRI